MKNTSPPPYRIGVEVGGTFTDLVWADGNGTVRTGKTPSTPHSIQDAVLELIRGIGIPISSAEQITHGSTIATNALIMRKGAQAGLLTTRGFRDAVILGRCERNGNVYDMQYRATEPPVRRHMIFEIDERVDAAGNVLSPIDLDAAWMQVEKLLERGVSGIAICLLHAYANPAHEIALASMIRERAPHVAVSASHEVSPEFREYERSVTTLVNAFVGPIVEDYIDKLDGALREDSYDGVLRIMQSNGGVMPAGAAGRNAVRMMLSGPAAGVRAAAWYAQRNGIADILTLDMGGTSTDVAIAPGLVPGMVSELIIDDLPLRTISIDMATIGAGGGSVAHVDRGGFLSVGPESVGSSPGPACYGKGGTRPALADAQMVAGLLRPADFFDGKMVLDMDKARAAIATLQDQGLSGSVEVLADSILRMANSNMAAAVRQISTARGIDPRNFTIVGYGGGGPLHAAMVAEDIGVKQVLIPWSPGLTSAFGLLIADTRIDAVESALHELSESSLDATRLVQLNTLTREIAAANGLAEGEYEVSFGLDMRYVAQAFELTVWASSDTHNAAELRSMFEEQHKQRYGYVRPKLGCEVVAYRLRLTQTRKLDIETPFVHTPGAPRQKISVVLNGVPREALLLPRSALGPGESIDGPAILTEPTSTTVVPFGWQAESLSTGDLILRDRK
ncbi:hydantoinase/oxoprolinase family protein [Nitratireductor aquimarinus]|uniref:hydantoinase/oxoprolinase family protein n=1 Tax=Nitratireductor aquimarinus TaxID=889300 RepID=UPI001A8DF594|nr:hydantoinase/oxoprolinase family protein [Nitratireductor aquimarinus]MBN8245664.1 hydantoinase/oxoprolinase family protein [Nitratireductor aquimarinus]MBY6134047.1 hydantoinase/oxoprolinase family protein [Nitratireductor aquimarinus]MCA1305143.1 hydantoinase/oxoprolinase family protein [Nitratireductor aquimarinus]